MASGRRALPSLATVLSTAKLGIHVYKKSLVAQLVHNKYSNFQNMKAECFRNRDTSPTYREQVMHLRMDCTKKQN